MFYERGRAVLTMILKAIEIIIICVVVFAMSIKKIKFRLRLKGITDPDEQKKKIKTYFIIDAVIFIILLMIYVLDHLK